jgi:hypothetical protein
LVIGHTVTVLWATDGLTESPHLAPKRFALVAINVSFRDRTHKMNANTLKIKPRDGTPLPKGWLLMKLRLLGELTREQ